MKIYWEKEATIQYHTNKLIKDFSGSSWATTLENCLDLCFLYGPKSRIHYFLQFLILREVQAFELFLQRNFNWNQFKIERKN